MAPSVSIDPKSLHVMICVSGGGRNSGMTQALAEIGIPAHSITMVQRHRDALTAFVKNHSINLILIDYRQGDSCSLDIVQKLKGENPDREVVTVIVADDDNQATAAASADDLVDHFVSRPFSHNTLKDSILFALSNRKYQAPYLDLLGKGQRAAECGDLDESDRCFLKALLIKKDSAVAISLMGHVQTLRGDSELAERRFSVALKINPMERRALLGLASCLAKKGQSELPLELLQRYLKAYVISQAHLKLAFEVAVRSRQFTAVRALEEHLRVFERPNEDLIRTACAALVISAKAQYRDERPAEAKRLIVRATTLAGSRSDILTWIAELLIEQKLRADALNVLKKFPPERRNLASYNVMVFKATEISASDTEIVTLGNRLIAEGILDKHIFATLIRRALRKGSIEMARGWLDKAASLPNDEWAQLAILVN